MTEFLTRSFDILTKKLMSWFEAIVALLPNFVLAVVIMLVTYGVARLARKLTERTLAAVFQDLATNVVSGLFITVQRPLVVGVSYASDLDLVARIVEEATSTTSPSPSPSAGWTSASKAVSDSTR